MIFKETPNEWYPSGFYLSENRMLAIGISYEFSNRLKLQVLHKGDKEFDDWFVVQEYVTYKKKLLDELFDKITKDLLSLDKYTEDWRKVFRYLPRRKKKYLEEEGGDV